MNIETYFEEKRDQTISVGIDEWGKGVINEKEIANLKTREGERDEKLIEIHNRKITILNKLYFVW